MEANESTKKKISAWKIASIVIFSLYAVMFFWYASCGELYYNEVHSNVVATASLQYSHSTIISASDFLLAKEDFPEIYGKVNSIYELDASGLVHYVEDAWIPYYFPAYPALCMPAKLILQGMGLEQSRAFSITNAILICVALFMVLRILKVRDRTRFFVLLFLMASPVFFYVNYINYELYMVAFAIISIVFYVNGRRRISALFLGVASLANQAIMVAGAAYIAFFIAETIYRGVKNRKKRHPGRFKKTILYTLTYACCFTPVFIPAIWRTSVMGYDMYLMGIFKFLASADTNAGIQVASSSLSAGMLTTYSGLSIDAASSWLERAWAYITDINLGVGSFALMQVVLAAVLIVFLILKKDFKSLVFAACFACVIAGVSIAINHICCGMIYCSRYVVWSYPFLAAFVGLNVEKLPGKRMRAVIPIGLCTLSIGVMYANAVKWDIEEYTTYNYVSTKILNNFPGLYNPIKCIFLSRTNNKDGGTFGYYDYSSIEPSYYADTANRYSTQRYDVRKILFRADESGIERVKNELVGDEQSMEWLSDVLNSYNFDGEYHYLNISKNSPYQFKKATPEETGQLTQGKKVADLSDVVLSENEDNATVGDSNFNYAYCYEYAEPITIRSNTYYKVEISVPKELRTDGLLSIDFFAEGYDNDEQESIGFVKKKVEKYVFYWNSGDLGTDKIYGYLRCMYYTDDGDAEPVINYLKCYKMKENNG